MMLFSLLLIAKFRQILIISSICLLSALLSPAQAFDLDNDGEFAIVHRNGQVTDMTLKVTKHRGQWQVQNQNAAGIWQDLGCSGDCKLVESSKDEVAYFMGGEEPEDMSAQCIHNVAYALCRVDVAGDTLPQYLFIALVAPPTAVSLVRVVRLPESN